jgi:hypothetical protein
MQSEAHADLASALFASLAEGRQAAARLAAGGPWAFDGLNELTLAVDARALVELAFRERRPAVG